VVCLLGAAVIVFGPRAQRGTTAERLHGCRYRKSALNSM
jgi:hypothetical protein